MKSFNESEHCLFAMIVRSTNKKNDEKKRRKIDGVMVAMNGITITRVIQNICVS